VLAHFQTTTETFISRRGKMLTGRGKARLVPMHEYAHLSALQGNGQTLAVLNKLRKAAKGIQGHVARRPYEGLHRGKHGDNRYTNN
jgi:hypothetical protein